MVILSFFYKNVRWTLFSKYLKSSENTEEENIKKTGNIIAIKHFNYIYMQNQIE